MTQPGGFRHSGARPCPTAMRASSTREEMPSLRKTWRRWVEGNRVHADEHLVSHLLVGQPLGDQLRHRAFGAGEAEPAGDRPGLNRPVPSPDAQPAKPPAHPRHIPLCPRCLAALSSLIEAGGGSALAAGRGQQFPEVLPGRRAGPRVSVPGGRLLQTDRVPVNDARRVRSRLRSRRRSSPGPGHPPLGLRGPARLRMPDHT